MEKNVSPAVPLYLMSFALKLLQMLPAEIAHRSALLLLAYAPFMLPAKTKNHASLNPSRYLPKKLAAMQNPIGLAAGFDKNAQTIHAIHRLGLGFAEIGTVTPKPQSGNPKPRLFRLKEQKAIINRMGFNNEGLAAMKKRLIRQEEAICIPIGINIGMNKTTENPREDYALLVRELGCFAQYVVLNVSSPNTPNLRKLQEREALAQLLSSVQTELDHMDKSKRPLLFIKVDPDLPQEKLEDIASLACQHKIDGIIVTNTTITRPAVDSHPLARENGGLSGKPLYALANKKLKELTTYLHKHQPEHNLIIIAAGGISSGKDAYQKFLLGAHLVQVYTALAYQGPILIESIKDDLKTLLQKDGYQHISEAIGKGIR